MVEKFQETPEDSKSQGGDVKPITETRGGLELRVGQLDGDVRSLKEKLENALAFRKWFIVVLITFISLSLAIGSFIFNMFNDSQKSYRDLQNRYYNELVGLYKDSLLNKKK